MIDLGKFHHDLTVLPNPGIMVYVREMIPFYGRTIQVSEKYNLPRYNVYLYADCRYSCSQLCVYVYIPHILHVRYTFLIRVIVGLNHGKIS